MPFVIMAMIVLLIVSDFQKELTNDFVKETKIEKIENENSNYDIVKQNILSTYDNKYDIIHGALNNLGDEETMDNITQIIFNKNKSCTYDNTIEKFQCDKFDLSTLSTNIDIQNAYKLFLSDIGEDFYIQFESLNYKKHNSLEIPMLNINIYKKDKMHLPILSSVEKINTENIINNKLKQSINVLDDINAYIEESGKRKFKGYMKLNHFAGKNPYSDLSEGIDLNYANGTSEHVYFKIGEDSKYGFHTTNVFIIPTYNMIANSSNYIQDAAENFGDGNISCGFTNAGYQLDINKNWYSGNSYYVCTYDVVASSLEIPLGYAGPDSVAALSFDMNKDDKIIGATAYTLKDFLKEKYFLDLKDYKNPFFPNSVLKDDLFILSSSNGYSQSSKIELRLGMKIINKRQNGVVSSDMLTRYIINSYNIKFN